MNSSDLSQIDMRLINAYMNGEASFQQLGGELGYAPDTLSRWLLTPSVASAINQLKNIELDRCHAVAARVRTTCMHMLANVLERANTALNEPRPSDVSPTPYIQHFMRVAALLSRLSTFKPTQLKELPPVTQVEPAQKNTATSNAASSTSNIKPNSPEPTSQRTAPTANIPAPAPVRRYPG